MSKLPDPSFNHPPLTYLPPGVDLEDMDITEQLRANAILTNESALKTQNMLQFFHTYKENRITGIDGVTHSFLSRIEGITVTQWPFKLEVRPDIDANGNIIGGEWICGQGYTDDPYPVHTVRNDTNGDSIEINGLDVWVSYSGEKQYIILEGVVSDDLSVEYLNCFGTTNFNETTEVQLDNYGYQNIVRLLIGVVYFDDDGSPQLSQAVHTAQVLTKGFHNGTICVIFNSHPATLQDSE